ncbi:MAG: helix-turn-helix domain-containing protein [Firmicutes bacterium]|nr:helix-turn-helix domain-containing protein [Bacillota bacterium]
MAEPKYPKIGRYARNSLRMKRQTVIDELKKYDISIGLNTLSNYESGITDTPASVLLHLAKIYDADIKYLFSKDELEVLDYFYFPNKTLSLSRNSNRLTEKGERLYDLNKNVTSPHINYKYIILEEDDPYMHLPKNTRLVYKEADGNLISINDEFDYFIIAKDILEGNNMVSKAYLTKAKKVQESQKPKLVYYINHIGEEAFMSEREFLDSIQGVITKIIIDIKTKNTANF